MNGDKESNPYNTHKQKNDQPPPETHGQCKQEKSHAQ